jgi:hypothetical protein
MTDLGTCPVLCRSKSLAARAICCAMVELDSSIGSSPVIATVPRHRMRKKKADVGNTLRCSNHVGLLVNEPPGMAGLPFI